MTRPDKLTKHIVDLVIDSCDRDDTAMLSAHITMVCNGKRFNNTIMAMALVLSDMIEDEDEPKKSAIALAVAFLALRASKQPSAPPGQPH